MSVPTEVATLAITGPDWFGSLADSRCSHWQPKMIHLDMAVDRGDYDAPTDRAVAATRDRLKLPEHFALYPAKAMTADVPVACSTVTCLPAITGGAAELFDPTAPNAIADAVARVWQDDSLRERLIADGRARATSFSWDRSARIFRACYRELGNHRLSAEDRALLDAPPPA